MIDASTSAEPKKESKVVWVVLLLPPGMSPLKIIAPEIPIPSLVREIKDEFKNMKVMKKKDDFEEPIKSKSKGKKQNNVGEVEKMKVNEKEIKSVNDTIRDVPYEECSAFINQSSSLQTGRTGVEGEGEGGGGGEKKEEKEEKERGEEGKKKKNKKEEERERRRRTRKRRRREGKEEEV